MVNKKGNVLLGITGCIAAYKVCELISLLKKDGLSVKVVMTRSAEQFVTPLTISTLTGQKAYMDMFSASKAANEDIEHISLASWADIFVVVPATANTIAKIAYGFADNLLTATILSLQKGIPLIVCPAMNVNMWQNEITKKNILLVKKRAAIVGPRFGKLACGVEGMGALARTEDIFQAIKSFC